MKGWREKQVREREMWDACAHEEAELRALTGRAANERRQRATGGNQPTFACLLLCSLSGQAGEEAAQVYAPTIT